MWTLTQNADLKATLRPFVSSLFRSYIKVRLCNLFCFLGLFFSEHHAFCGKLPQCIFVPLRLAMSKVALLDALYSPSGNIPTVNLMDKSKKRPKYSE